MSNETSYGVSEFVNLAKSAGLPKIVSIQNSYSLLVRVPYETDLAECCHRHNVGLLAYSPLAGGALSNKYNDGSADKGSRFNLFPGYMSRYNASLVSDHRHVMCWRRGMNATLLRLAGSICYFGVRQGCQEVWTHSHGDVVSMVQEQV